MLSPLELQGAQNFQMKTHRGRVLRRVFWGMLGQGDPSVLVTAPLAAGRQNDRAVSPFTITRFLVPRCETQSRDLRYGRSRPCETLPGKTCAISAISAISALSQRDGSRYPI